MSESNSLSAQIETPLHYLQGRALGHQDQADIQIKESEQLGHLIIRGDGGDDFAKAVESALGVALPQQPNTTTSNEKARLFWLSPNEWLVLLALDKTVEAEQTLRDKMSGHIAVVDVSGGQTLLNLSGDNARLVLQKTTGYDVHPRHLSVGRCTQTQFAKATALIAPQEDGSFDLVIRRSFADYIGLWLLDAGSEYGVQILNSAD